MISTFLLFLLAAMAALCTERLKAAWCVAACLLYALTVYNVHSEVEGTLSTQEQQARSRSSLLSNESTLHTGVGCVRMWELVLLHVGGGGRAVTYM